jgi:ligand-binding sensor domain-containing protein
VLLSFVAIVAKAEQLPIKLYSGTSGLGSSYIIAIVRDPNGLMWFCTRDGLSRFDGQQFVTYNLEHGLPHPTVNHLLKTRDGTYWIATNGGGVCRFNPEAESAPLSNGGKRLRTLTLDPQANCAALFEVHTLPGRSRENSVNVIFEDRAGRIWVGTDSGLFQLQEGETGVTFQPFALLEPHPHPTVARLFEDREGSLWITTAQGLTRRLPNGRLIHYQVSWGQLVAGLCDAIENALLLNMLWQVSANASMPISRIFTIIKFALVIAGLLYVYTSAIILSVQKFAEKRA